MRAFVCGLCGTLIGGGVGYALSYCGDFREELIAWPIAACGFSWIGAMLGTLGGLWVARATGAKDEPPK